MPLISQISEVIHSRSHKKMKFPSYQKVSFYQRYLVVSVFKSSYSDLSTFMFLLIKSNSFVHYFRVHRTVLRSIPIPIISNFMSTVVNHLLFNYHLYTAFVVAGIFQSCCLYFLLV